MRPISASRHRLRRSQGSMGPTSDRQAKPARAGERAAAAAAQPWQRPARAAWSRPRAPRSFIPEQSAALRDRLLGEIADCHRRTSATDWARAALAAKNRLTADDAKLVEDAFEQRLSALVAARDDDAASDDGGASDSGSRPAMQEPSPRAATVRRRRSANRHRQERARDRRAAPLPQPRPPSLCRQAALPDLRPQAVRPASPAPLQPRALGRKASDEFTVPLCRIHHRLVHRVGNEASLVAGRRHRSDQSGRASCGSRPA